MRSLQQQQEDRKWHVPEICERSSSFFSQMVIPSVGSIPGPCSLHVSVIEQRTELIMHHQCEWWLLMSKWPPGSHQCVTGWMVARRVKCFAQNQVCTHSSNLHRVPREPSVCSSVWNTEQVRASVVNTAESDQELRHNCSSLFVSVACTSSPEASHNLWGAKSVLQAVKGQIWFYAWTATLFSHHRWPAGCSYYFFLPDPGFVIFLFFC